MIKHVFNKIPKETIVKKKQPRIKNEFKSKAGLIIDKPKPEFGRTNDGNTAHRFFDNPNLSSCITGVDKEYVELKL